MLNREMVEAAADPRFSVPARVLTHRSRVPTWGAGRRGTRGAPPFPAPPPFGECPACARHLQQAEAPPSPQARIGGRGGACGPRGGAHLSPRLRRSGLRACCANSLSSSWSLSPAGGRGRPAGTVTPSPSSGWCGAGEPSGLGGGSAPVERSLTGFPARATARTRTHTLLLAPA